MDFKIFVAVFNLLIPLTMLGFGQYFSNHAPKEINSIYGYRTPMSMKNQETWLFAHHHCGKTWKTFGTVLLLVSAAVDIPVFFLSETNLLRLFSALCLVQLICLVASIVPTEKALKKTFDEKGNRREPGDE